MYIIPRDNGALSERECNIMHLERSNTITLLGNVENKVPITPIATLTYAEAASLMVLLSHIIADHVSDELTDRAKKERA